MKNINGLNSESDVAMNFGKVPSVERHRDIWAGEQIRHQARKTARKLVLTSFLPSASSSPRSRLLIPQKSLRCQGYSHTANGRTIVKGFGEGNDIAITSRAGVYTPSISIQPEVSACLGFGKPSSTDLAHTSRNFERIGDWVIGHK